MGDALKFDADMTPHFLRGLSPDVIAIADMLEPYLAAWDSERELADCPEFNGLVGARELALWLAKVLRTKGAV